MSVPDIREAIKKELPILIREDPEILALVLDLAKQRFADRAQTESQFDLLLRELQEDRQEQKRRWDEQQGLWDEQQGRWDEQQSRWDEQQSRWDEQQSRWDKQQSRWDDQQSRWEEHKREFDRVHEEIMAIAEKHEHNMGAIGARWGIQTEESFRNGLAAILEKSFGVDVVNVAEYDEEGDVFGRPDQVELDVIVKNGTLILCEIKSSIDKAGMYIFERKARFYEKRHHRKADRLLVISPMVDSRARRVAEKLGIEVYSHSRDVESRPSNL